MNISDTQPTRAQSSVFFVRFLLGLTGTDIIGHSERISLSFANEMLPSTAQGLSTPESGSNYMYCLHNAKVLHSHSNANVECGTPRHWEHRLFRKASHSASYVSVGKMKKKKKKKKKELKKEKKKKKKTGQGQFSIEKRVK